MDSTMKLCDVDFVIIKDEGETDMDSVQSKVCEDLIQDVLPFKHDKVNGEETQTDVKESNGDMCLQNITPINENDENQIQNQNNLNQKRDIKIADAKNFFWNESSYENASHNNEEDANSTYNNMPVFKNSKHIYNEELGTIQKLQHDNSFNKRLHGQNELNSKVTLFKHAPPKVKQNMSKDPHKDGHDTFNIGQFAADKDYDMNDNICEIENASDCSSVCEVEVNQLMYRFAGGVFRSLRERPKQRRRWSLGEWNGENMKPEAELSRSQYSLVSCTDLTAGAVQLWLGLPEEVKYDPALAPFRQFYEKEQGKLENKKSSAPLKQRLPSVNSAPHLHNNQHAVREEPFGRNEKIPEKTDKLLEEDHETTVPKKTTVQKAQHYVKMTLLLACWVFFTTAFLMYNENEPITRNSSVAPGEVKHYHVTSGGTGRFSILLSLSGPFLSDTGEAKLNASAKLAAKKMEVWLERVSGNGDAVQTSDTWKLVLQNELDLDFSEGEPRSSTLRLQPYGLNGTSNVSLRIRTTVNSTTPFAMSYTLNPLDLQTGVLYASLLLFGLYVLIIFEVINRTMAAVLISTLALATLSIVGERPSLPEIVSWLDVETLLLLFSMMLLVAIMAETGMFDFLAVFTFEVTKGKLWPLISLLCTITAVLSTFLDNVTTVLLMTPVTIRLCEVMDLDPIPVLMSMVLFSNIGGTATPVGDPPNVIIASNKAVVQAGINFTNFTLHMTLGILLVCIQTYFQLRFIYRDTSKLRLKEPREIKDLRHQISIWRRAAESLPHMSRDEHVVRERLERKVKKLSVQLETLVRESNKRACPKDTFQTTLADMKEKYKIRDKPLLIKSTIAIGFVVTVFFLHSIPELNRVSLGWTALLGAILLLTLADREDLEPILHRVEWSTLLFFAALFVLMEALSKLGLIEFIGGLTERIILSVDESARLAVSILLMLWVSGITSAFVDNIPLTTMMVRVVTSLGSNPALNLPMAPLIWALSFGACLGGNGTLIGASANVVCAGVAEHHGYKFSFMQFFKIGFPIMIGHLIVASGYLLFCHCLFTWH